MFWSNVYVHPKEVLKEIPRDSIRGAKIAFINMPLRESAPPNCLPYGVCLLAAIVRRHGADPSIIDLNGVRKNTQPLSDEDARFHILDSFIRNGEPDIVALSGIVTTLRWQEKIAKMIREILPDVFLVSGNGLATEFKGGLFNWIPELNAVAHSEGDLSIVKIIFDALKIKSVGLKMASSSGYLDPYYLGEALGRPRFIYDGGRPDDLDSLPLPAYDLLGNDVMETYINNPIWGENSENSSRAGFTMGRSMNTISSRGCPFACRFCFRGATGERKYGMRTAGNFADEMDLYRKNHGVDFIGILDDNFMVNKKRVVDFSNIMKNVNIKWGVHGRMDEAQDERIESIAKGNCRYIGFGGESASAKTLEAMGKGGFTLTNGMEKIGEHSFPKTYVNAIRNTRRAGINANCTWMMGYPGETLEDLKTTIAFIKWQEGLCGDVNKNLFMATAYPGTELFGHPKVKERLMDGFGISYDEHNQPIVNDALRQYVISLDDATKLLTDKNGRIVNFSEMTDDQLGECKKLVDEGCTEKILNL